MTIADDVAAPPPEPSPERAASRPDAVVGAEPGPTRRRRRPLSPFAAGSLYVAGGLLWLLVGAPPLVAWLRGDSAAALSGQWPGALAILVGGGLLVRLLRARGETAARIERDRDAKLAEFMAHCPDMAFIKDIGGRYASINPAGAQLADRPVAECLNRVDSDLFPPEIARQWTADDRRVLVDGILLNREDTATLGGERRVLLSTRWPYRNADGAVIGVLGIIRDITARRAAEERSRPTRADRQTPTQERASELLATNRALERQIAARIQAEIARRDSEERFRQLAEHIREVFWVYGIAEERLLYVSPAYEEVWGQPIAGLHERPLEWIEAVHPDDRPRVRAAHLEKQTSGHFDQEYRIVRPDGTIRWIWDRGFPIRDEAGHVYRIAGLAEDITARKLADDQLRRQQVELARMARLSLAVELASNLAHELNQPLAAIVAYTQACLTLLRQASTDPRELTGTLDEVVSQGLRAGEIIRHLRDLVRKHPAAQAALDLNALIRAVVHYAQLELRQSGVTLRLELMESLPPALADDIQIQLVVLYLIRNAVEAMQEAERTRRELTVRTAALDANWVMATVRDTGPAFGPETADLLFRPFFSTKAGNMGLGLSVSRSIVESQGGQIWATTNPDGGASFHFTLPVHADP